MLKDFEKRFNLEPSIIEERRRFVNRINEYPFEMYRKLFKPEAYNSIFKETCYVLGKSYSFLLMDNGYKPSISEITLNDFNDTLRALIAFYHSAHKGMQEAISQHINNALEQCTIDLGISWKDGIFYPSGEKVLDEELVNYTLDVLRGYDDERKDIEIALRNYYAKDKYGVIENCYNSLEGFCRKLFSNTNTLIDNKPNIFKSLGLSEQWKKIIGNFVDYANEYRRHAGEKRHDLKEEEVEAYLYMTCLIIRILAKQKVAQTSLKSSTSL